MKPDFSLLWVYKDQMHLIQSQKKEMFYEIF